MVKKLINTMDVQALEVKMKKCKVNWRRTDMHTSPVPPSDRQHGGNEYHYRYSSCRNCFTCWTVWTLLAEEEW